MRKLTIFMLAGSMASQSAYAQDEASLKQAIERAERAAREAHTAATAANQAVEALHAEKAILAEKAAQKEAPAPDAPTDRTWAPEPTRFSGAIYR